MGRLKYAMVCSSNMNRSMEAHRVLSSEGLQVESYGVGQRVKLPGQKVTEPNVYDFGTPYRAMAADLRSKAEEFYSRKGLLGMLERNARIKEAPQRWQTAEHNCDVAITFEERILDQLLDETQSRRQQGTKPLLVINLDVIDNQDEAAAAAPLVLKLCQQLDSAPDLLPAVDEILSGFQRETGRKLLHDVCFV